jgi:hypothetical protein
MFVAIRRCQSLARRWRLADPVAQFVAERLEHADRVTAALIHLEVEIHNRSK